MAVVGDTAASRLSTKIPHEGEDHLSIPVFADKTGSMTTFWNSSRDVFRSRYALFLSTSSRSANSVAVRFSAKEENTPKTEPASVDCGPCGGDEALQAVEVLAAVALSVVPRLPAEFHHG